ncbi:MAG: restriction endonuclease subunit S [Gemmatimonas sp.]|uniref:restriction endonuclease subunit S n=1 Tax=Gemmatimonas sp. TaxID=1962908 RepID=UPI00391FCA5C
MNTKELKPDWRRVKFGDVVQLSKARSQDPLADGIERYVGLEHLEPGDLRIRSWGSVADGVTFTSIFKPGQVLFGKRRAYQRKVAVAEFSGVCSGDIYVLETKDPTVLLPEMLPFICQTDGFFDHAVGTSAGSLSPRTNWTSLATFDFSLPPIAEQERLIELLRTHADVVESLQVAKASADRARRAALLDIFRPQRGVTDSYPAHWETLRIDELGDVQLGQQRHPKFERGSNMRRYLRVANVLDGWIDFADLNEMHFPEADVKKFELQPGDILLNEGQSFDLVGRSAIYRGEIDGICCQKTLIRFRCGPSMLPEYAQAYFQHRLYTGQFAAMCVQTTSMAHLTAVRFGAMKVPVPPLQEQSRIASLVDCLAATVHELSRRIGRTVALKTNMEFLS